jgi:photosystem II stability/assembly factor-like uncharacterized protein
MKQYLLALSTLACLLVGCHKDPAGPDPGPDPWQPVLVSNNPAPIRLLEEVRFSSAQVGWISGGIDQDMTGNPVLLKTLNGGATWTSIDLRQLRISRFVALAPVNDQLLYACAPDLSLNFGSPRVLAKSVDGGLTWQRVAQTGLNGSFSLWFFTEQTGLSANINRILKTTDGGATWRTAFEEPLAGLDKLQCFASGTAYAAGGGGGYDGTPSAGILLKSTDSGETWQKLPWPYARIMTLSFLNEQVGFAATGDRQLYQTRNGGTSWQQVTSQLPAGTSHGVFLNEQEGYLPGPALYHTTNGGQSWQAEHALPTTDRFVGLSFSPAGTGVATTAAGIIVKK